ncbi:serine hydrolase [Methylocystis rosea]|uniref:D-alanyl-D-alanine carboxypeptidase n=1 Tax=Methylocystis rosea TaxID=173366 RepID=A0A3G8M3I3_9HYPH|nr:serine hydrolase [Methylocystis rosea]AZG76496.1 D-alanyl-D-alanine carboxypeptidase [Methylocystis rosea]
MLRSSLSDRLPRPRSLAASFATITVLVTMSAIHAEARGRHHFHHRSASDDRNSAVRARANANNDAVIGEHRGFSAIVVDANSGRALYSRSEHELRHPASVTKVMTLYLLFEQLEQGRLRLDSPLMISQHAAAQAPSKLGLRPGQTISVDNAIKAVVTKSANDIACAIAENVAGDEHSFAQMMTRKAHALGMRNTNYENASGLPDPNQVTTAYDLALLGRAIQERFPRYYRYFSTPSFAYNGALHRNHNHLLGQVEGMDGIKTGYTRASGFNLLTSVRRRGHHIVAVVMGGKTAYGRDRIMAGLIEENIDGGSSVRTAAAVSEDPRAIEAQERLASERTQRAERAAERAHQIAAERLAYAEPQENSAVEPEPFGRQLNAPVPAAAIPPQESAERPAVRPAFVSGGQKRASDDRDAERKGASPGAKSRAGATPVAARDGSTTSGARKIDVTPVSTTPSAIRGSSPKSQAKADAARPGRPGWMIQIGATDDQDKANQLLVRARSQLQGFPATAKAFTEKVQRGSETLYRARFAGLEEDTAQSACKALKRSGFSCFTTKN